MRNILADKMNNIKDKQDAMETKLDTIATGDTQQLVWLGRADRLKL